jgi:acyl-coenzyme A synthetase/AMP-(fatty) acid ligase
MAIILDYSTLSCRVNKRYVFVAELPKNAYSKVLKTVLRQQLTLESPA